MAHKKINKYPAKNQRLRKTGPIVVRSGAYNGATSSNDFVVSGHSTGSPNSEMEAISQQLSRDVGNGPEYPLESTNDLTATGYEEYEGEGLGDLGGPEFYGNKPSLLKKSPIHFVNEARRLTMGTAAVAIAGSAVLAGLAYALIRNVRHVRTSISVAGTPAKRVRAKAKGASKPRLTKPAKASAKAASRKSTRSSRTSDVRAH